MCQIISFFPFIFILIFGYAEQQRERKKLCDLCCIVVRRRSSFFKEVSLIEFYSLSSYFSTFFCSLGDFFHSSSSIRIYIRGIPFWWKWGGIFRSEIAEANWFCLNENLVNLNWLIKEVNFLVYSRYYAEKFRLMRRF